MKCSCMFMLQIELKQASLQVISGVVQQEEISGAP